MTKSEKFLDYKLKSNDDIARLRAEYEDRKKRLANSDRYSLSNISNLFILQQRQRHIILLLKKYKLLDLSHILILEMGCGNGGVLSEFKGFGAPQQNIFGVDLLFNRLLIAHNALTKSNFVNTDGTFLPFPIGTFNIVLQFTALSSILDPDLRSRICAEMLRVLRPGGMILWYDFWINPSNPQTHGIRPKEIRNLFPHCSYDFHKITLAPPISRRVVPVSWITSLFIEKLSIFNSHYLVAIRPTN